MGINELIKDSPKEELDNFTFYKLTVKNNNVNFYVSKKRATKATLVHCTESGDVIWEQLYPFGGMSRPSSEKKYALKPQRDKNAITVVIIRGTPGNITGLDDGIFRSHLATPEKNYIYLMTEKNLTKFLESI
ncbi:MAG: hypothetical protein IKC87_00160 [Clostridia bacterium]|nr:hypothetical protein [Clostridia bacterium]